MNHTGSHSGAVRGGIDIDRDGYLHRRSMDSTYPTTSTPHDGSCKI